ncbi:MAG: hypothetical protein NC231_03045 [Bacillus sp. (in: Bacteria)]|nr:hypothetical protein [Bacillus sp. (in: firmicutes)]MCM1426049.1 hypothetical protein [Eubacterium sp.]
MATSTFGKHFFVKPEKAAEFVDEMSKVVPPTLTEDFSSNLVHLSQDTVLKEKIKKALGE